MVYCSFTEMFQDLINNRPDITNYRYTAGFHLICSLFALINNGRCMDLEDGRDVQCPLRITFGQVH